jgi:hypothetical protein
VTDDDEEDTVARVEWCADEDPVYTNDRLRECECDDDDDDEEGGVVPKWCMFWGDVDNVLGKVYGWGWCCAKMLTGTEGDVDDIDGRCNDSEDDGDVARMLEGPPEFDDVDETVNTLASEVHVDGGCSKIFCGLRSRWIRLLFLKNAMAEAGLTNQFGILFS